MLRIFYLPLEETRSVSVLKQVCPLLNWKGPGFTPRPFSLRGVSYGLSALLAEPSGDVWFSIKNRSANFHEMGAIN